MKRVFSLLTAVAVLFCLGGCRKKSVIQPITDGFTAQADIRYKDMDVKGQFSCGNDGRVTMVFSEPKSLEGVILGWNGNEMQMQLGSMTLAVAEDSVPDGGLIRYLTRILSSVEPKKGKKDGGDYVIKGKVGDTAYTLTCDAATGYPKTLSVPDEKLTAHFSEVKKL